MRRLSGTKIAGIVLVVLGILGLAYGGLSWTSRETVVDAGPIEITADKTERLPLPPLAGGLLVVAGVVLILKK
jgi:drug/metabolite transporter (DMT)-like permease